jgi:acetoin utilization protein AcuC
MIVESERETRMPTPLTIAYSENYLKWLLGAGDGSHPTNPIRAKIATEMLVKRLGDQVRVVEPAWTAATREAVESIHDPSYVSAVVDDGRSSEWTGLKTELGETALLMFEGTKVLVEQMIAGDTTVGFNPQGAKHHAQYAHGEGFCVFNDMAWAAIELKKAGLKPLYIDWDVHAGNGVQDLLGDTDIPTLSIHRYGIYPTHSDVWDPKRPGGGNYEYHNPESHWYNWCLEGGGGDKDLAWAMEGVTKKVDEYQPNILLLATGADGHQDDNWGMKYTDEGFKASAAVVADLADKYCHGRVLIGGAGGYVPTTTTPRVWADVVEAIYSRNAR